MAKKQTPDVKTEAPKCPITKAQFLTHAKPIVVAIAGRELIASVKEFSTGSLGWYAGEKIAVVIDGIPCKVQVGINLTLVGSKEAK